MTDNMVTKQELKQELKAFATKKDLEAFATKQNVKEIVREETADIRNEQLRQGVLLEKVDNAAHIDRHAPFRPD